MWGTCEGQLRECCLPSQASSCATAPAAVPCTPFSVAPVHPASSGIGSSMSPAEPPHMPPWQNSSQQQLNVPAAGSTRGTLLLASTAGRSQFLSLSLPDRSRWLSAKPADLEVEVASTIPNLGTIHDAIMLQGQLAFLSVHRGSSPRLQDRLATGPSGRWPGSFGVVASLVLSSLGMALTYTRRLTQNNVQIREQVPPERAGACCCCRADADRSKSCG